MKTLLLIDAHALIHRAFHALPPMSDSKGVPTQALYGVASILLKTWKDERPEFAAAFFDRPEPTFRKKEYKEYKAQRPKAPEALISQIIEARNLFDAFGIKVFELPGFEADDLIGTFAKRYSTISDLRVMILTGDLDALQLVEDNKVIVKTLKIGVSSTETYNREAVINRYGIPPELLPDYKTLVGDPSDNIPGVAGVGPKTAGDLLKKYGSLEKIVASIQNEPKYSSKFEGQGEKISLFRRLVYIRRDAPLDSPDLSELTTNAAPEKLLPYFNLRGFESLEKRFMGNSANNQMISRKNNISNTQNLFADKTPTKSLIISDDIIIIRNEDSINAIDLTSFKIKIGFGLKDIIKKYGSSSKVLKTPYFDIGIGFWVCYPDYKKYLPEELFPKFMGHEWTGSDDDYISAYKFIQKEIENDNLKKIFEKIEIPLIQILAEMESKGIAVDKKVLVELKDEIQKEINKCEDSIYGIIGKKINLNSQKQLGELLFRELNLGRVKNKKTPKGKLSTDEEVLRDLKDSHPVVEIIILYREIYKLLSTYIKPALELCDSDNRIRTNFIQTGTATGRLSSQNPNLQNVPIGNKLAEKFRRAFVPAPGFKFVSFDYSQLELRLLASLSEDEKMISAFKRGDDIHSITASTVLGIPLSEVTSEKRRLAKTLNFGIVYGMGPRAFSKSAGIKMDEAKKFISDYFKEFKAVRVWQELIKNEARKSGIVRNLNGRLRRVPAMRFGGSRESSAAERVVLNMPIQSLGADIIKLAMIKVTDEIYNNKSWGKSVSLLLSIHDELLFEVRNDMIKEVEPLIQKIMESVYIQSVPLKVNVKKGENWADLL